MMASMNKAGLALFAVVMSLGMVSKAVGQTAHTDHSAVTMPAERSAKWKAALAKPAFAMSATFDEKGRLWRTSALNGYVITSHSDDHGKTWSQAVRVNTSAENILADGENRPKILIRKGVIYISWTQALDKPMTGHIRFSRSTDGGKTFSPPVTVNDNPGNHQPPLRGHGRQ